MSSLLQLGVDSVFAGDFKVVRPLTEGGMGAVYVVEQISTGKQRALKIMHPQLLHDATMRQRFVQEAKVGARVESDHLCEVVSAGIDAATNTPWMVMELLIGETLEAMVERMGARPKSEVQFVFSQLCHAVGAAHDVGIVHRDLKPENIFLCVPRREGVPYVVKVLDFGIAKLVAESDTRSTQAIGSPLWMSPEQAQTGSVISPATDVWSLGLIAFWMLTGYPFWKGARKSTRTR
jgi:serine/threonine protein kinase